ncbi:MAG TPA: YncE family protein, partial [Candidatus Acidoferrum sp.]|nr:YncE family protein [Candidatus Acidoferrum sp.]
ILATVPVGVHPQAVAINPVTNKIYVANMGDGSVTVIDGVTNHPTGVYTGGGDPYAVAVNSETNTIYVANLGGTVSVIDGATNWFINVPVGRYPDAVAVNPVSNLIYVTNYGDGTVSVIDGAHNTIVATVVVGDGPGSIAVDPVTNAIYVANSVTGTVSAFNGVDRLVTTVPVRSSPYAVVLNPTTNRVYVANSGDGTVSVIAGLNSDPLQFIPVTPCRLYDTRPQYGGGGPILGGTFQSFPIQGMDSCGDVIPAPPLAYSLNVTVVPAGPLGYLTVWPSGEDRPALSTLNSPDGQVKASAAIVPAGAGAAISVYASNTTNVLLDINGYFTAVSKSTLAFYPLTPCRVADTRWANGPLGGPLLQGGAPGRDFPVTSSGCRIPASAQAYSLNFTAVPKGPLDHLTAWAAGQEQPGVFTLSAMTGLVTSNSAIVQAGGGGDIQVFVSDDSHVIIDINGYFGPAAPGGLSLNGTAPCRMLDTRNTTGAFSERIGVSKVFTCRWGI